MRTLVTLFTVAILAALGTVGFALSGLHDPRATTPHNGVIHWLLSTTSRASVERRASRVEVPDLTDDALLLAGVNDFAEMCAGCHGAPGQPLEAVGQGLNPKPPDLAESATHMTPAELFWVTRNGIRMTGMPAWGVTHDDQALWPVVAFMTALPELDSDAYQALRTRAQGSGHHSGSHDGMEPDHDGPDVNGDHGQHDRGTRPSTEQVDVGDSRPQPYDDDETTPKKTKEADGHDHKH